MTTVASRSSRRPSLVALGVLTLLLTGCNARGGGQLPPAGVVFPGSASFGFSFSCEDKGGLNPQPGQLRIQLSYSERGRNPLGPSFSVHGTADEIDPVTESMLCIGQNPPPGGNELIFLGQYRFTGSPPSDGAQACVDSTTTPPCRFEVRVRDNDRSLAPSSGDFFSITLSNATALTSGLDAGSVLYSRAGTLSSGNLTVE